MVISFLFGYLWSTYTYKLPDNHISNIFTLKDADKQTQYISSDKRWVADTYTDTSQYRPYIRQLAIGMIASDAYKSRGDIYRYRLRLRSLAGIDIAGEGYLYTKNSTLRYGDIIETALNITQSRPTNPGQIDYATNMAREGIYFTAREYTPIEVIDHQGSPIKKRVYQIKDWLHHRYEKMLTYALPIALATVLSERGYLEQYGEDFPTELNTSGVLHLFAVSGLHIGIFTLILMLLVSILRIPRTLGNVIVVFFLLTYILILNGSPPIVRAGIIVLLMMMADWLDRIVSPWQILLMTLFFATLIYPKSLFSVSLQYTFLAYSGIIFSMELSDSLMHKWRDYLYDKEISNVFFTKIIPYIIQYLAVVTCIQLMILPVSIYYFNQINLNAFFANLVCIPLFSLLLPLLFMIIILPFPLFINVAEALSALFFHTIRFFSRFPFVYDVYVGTLKLIFMMIMIFFGMLLIVYGKNHLRRIEGAVLCVLSLFLLIASPKEQGFEMVFFDVGNGDACLVRFSNEDIMIVDVAEFDNNGKNISRNMVRYLQEQHISSIHKVLLTHNHSDHYGGIKYLGEHIPIDTLIVNQSFMVSEMAQDIRRNKHFADTVFWVIDDTLTYRKQDYQMQFLHPSDGFFDTNENNNSIVCRLVYQNVSILFAGDIERRVEDMLLRESPENLKSDILKAAHHGSGTSSSFKFVEAVDPEVFIISASNNQNRYLTSPTTFTTASHFANKVYQTGKDGAVVMRFRF